METNSLAERAAATTYRRATQDEIQRATMVLRSLNESLANFIETEHKANLGSTLLAIVITDFSDVPEGTEVLLVPHGNYDVPIEVLDRVRYIIGLSWERSGYPILNLQGEANPVMNSDTCEETELVSGRSVAAFIGVELDAPRHTVLEVWLDEKQFSDMFFNVKWTENVDAYAMPSSAVCNGWRWVLDAYGESVCRPRSALEKGLDAVHQGTMNTIDGIFRPLVHLAEKADQLLGLK